MGFAWEGSCSRDTARVSGHTADATYSYLREGRWITAMALVVAYGVNEDGVREFLGLRRPVSIEDRLYRFRELLTGSSLWR